MFILTSMADIKVNFARKYTFLLSFQLVLKKRTDIKKWFLNLKYYFHLYSLERVWLSDFYSYMENQFFSDVFFFIKYVLKILFNFEKCNIDNQNLKEATNVTCIFNSLILCRGSIVTRKIYLISEEVYSWGQNPIGGVR